MTACGIYKLGNRIVHGQKIGKAHIHSDKVCRASLPKPAKFGPMQAGRAVDGSHVEDSLGGKGSRVRNFVQQGCLAHFGKNIQLIVAGRPIGAKANVKAGSKHVRHWRDAGSQFHVWWGIVRHANIFIRKDGDFILV